MSIPGEKRSPPVNSWSEPPESHGSGNPRNWETAGKFPGNILYNDVENFIKTVNIDDHVKPCTQHRKMVQGHELLGLFIATQGKIDDFDLFVFESGVIPEFPASACPPRIANNWATETSHDGNHLCVFRMRNKNISVTIGAESVFPQNTLSFGAG